ncbi:MAG TPA: hypothetical protein VK403_06720 [Allosphingosinicella sp.]|nr:hypothetical protein [Allosphingosinicella sp.]
MQFDPQRAFPYPVLRPGVDDYIDGDIQVTVDVQTSPDQRIVRAQVEFVVSVPDIVSLVKEGRAQYVAVFSCRDTYLRRSFKSQAPAFSVEFQDAVLRGEVSIHGYVVASQTIRKYFSSLLNQEFEGTPVEFPRGAVLAIDEPQAVYIDRDLLRPITSIFSLTKKEGLAEYEWSLNLDDEKVLIEVSPAFKERLDHARNSTENRAILINSIYFGAVMQALKAVREEESDFADRRWAQVLTQSCTNAGIPPTLEEYAAAERLMRFPMGLLDKHIFSKGNE